MNNVKRELIRQSREKSLITGRIKDDNVGELAQTGIPAYQSQLKQSSLLFIRGYLSLQLDGGVLYRRA